MRFDLTLKPLRDAGPCERTCVSRPLSRLSRPWAWSSGSAGTLSHGQSWVQLPLLPWCSGRLGDVTRLSLPRVVLKGHSGTLAQPTLLPPDQSPTSLRSSGLALATPEQVSQPRATASRP